MADILIVDDEPSILESLEMFLTEKGHSVYKAVTGKGGFELFIEYKPRVVILDIRLPDSDGLDLLKKIQKIENKTKVIMMTAFQDMETTIEAMKRGAYDYIHKPLDIDQVEKAVNGAIHILEVDQETPLLKEVKNPLNTGVIIGKSDKMREIFKTIGLLCQNRATVLIQGETGTGKELIARVIHRNSLFDREPFITLDCSAVVETLLESELFGHEKGAFTGAGHTKQGRIELAGGGTLFLDEIGELPFSLQGKFLGFLQRREYMRVGGQKILQSNCRIMAATHRDLTSLVQKGQFREDLYFRLRVVNVRVPPLREKLEDLSDLTHHFLKKINHDLDTSVSKLQHGVIERLKVHPWNGNVRELENILVEAVVRANGPVIMLEDIDRILTSSHSLPEIEYTRLSLQNVEKEHIKKALARVDWNRTRAAKTLGISLPTLRKKIKKYNITPS